MLKSQTPHIGIFGRRNIGKSSFINAISKQKTAIVSDTAGTTTDAVFKRMEIPNVGPAILIDTAGVDDVGELGQKRVLATKDVMSQVDLAIILVADNEITKHEDQLIEFFKGQKTKVFLVHNKGDISPLTNLFVEEVKKNYGSTPFDFSCEDRRNIDDLLAHIKEELPEGVFDRPTILGDLVSYGQTVLMVVPIDIEAPEGRLIMPQVQTMRDILDNDCIGVMVKERELDSYLDKAKRNNDLPALVVTDSQAFMKVGASVPKEIPLTSFSLLFARLKGDFEHYLQGTHKIAELENGDRVLILESCSHHATGDDIGRVKIPRWIRQYTGKELEFDIVAGLSRVERPISDYSLVVQCGGCMLTRSQVINRLRPAVDAGVPVTNYGMAISFCLGIFDRAVAPLLGEKSVEAKADYL